MTELFCLYFLPDSSSSSLLISMSSSSLGIGFDLEGPAHKTIRISFLYLTVHKNNNAFTHLYRYLTCVSSFASPSLSLSLSASLYYYCACELSSNLKLPYACAPRTRPTVLLSSNISKYKQNFIKEMLLEGELDNRTRQTLHQSTFERLFVLKFLLFENINLMSLANSAGVS